MKLRVGARVIVDDRGERVEFTDLQQALLLIMADARGEMPRSRVAELLWTVDTGSTSPRRRLRQIVYGVNRRVPDALLVGDQTRLALSEDVEVIWTGEEVGASIQAPSPSWARVLEDVRDRARSLSRSHVASAVDSARLRDDPEAILELIATDADPSSMWRDAVWALLRAGRIREAEASFGELGIDDPELVRRCRDAVARLASGDAPGPVPHSVHGPVVGRAEVLGEAISALERGDRRVVLAGPSGVGLSRSLGAVAAWVLAEQDDLVVASTQCSYSGRNLAYDTLNHLFDSELFRAAHDEVDEPWRSILARVLRIYGRSPDRDIELLEGTAATLRVLHAVSALIQKALGNATLLAVVDDLHLADPGSLTVLNHLGVDGEGAVIRLLGTCRRDTEMEIATRALLDQSDSTIIDVPPLDSASSEAMLRALRPELTGETARALAGLCSGYPRRLEDVARSVDDRGGQVEQTTLDDLLHARLADLDGAQQDVSALLSMRPDGLEAETLMGACDLGTLELSRATRRLIELGIVEDGARIRIWSSFLRRGIRSTIPASIRRALHLRLATVLMERDPPVAGDIGRHLKEGGEDEQAALWLTQAAREAANAEAFPVATELAELAVEVASDDGDLRELLGDLLSSEGRFKEASGHLERAWQLAARDAPTAATIGLRLKWLRSLCEHVFDPEDVGGKVREVLNDALAAGELDIEAHAIDLMFRVGDYCLDFDLVYEALDRLLEARRRDVQSPYLDWVEVRRSYIDDPVAARSAAWRFLRWSDPGTPDRLMALTRVINQGMLKGAPGDADVRSAIHELSDFESSGHSYLRATAILSTGNWHLERGDLDTARQAFDQALGNGRSLDGGVTGATLANRVEIALQLGRVEEARDLLNEIEAGLRALPPRDRMILDFAEAWFRLEVGEIARATELISRWPNVGDAAPTAFALLLPVRVRSMWLARRGRREEARRALAPLRQRASALGMLRLAAALAEIERGLRP